MPSIECVFFCFCNANKNLSRTQKNESHRELSVTKAFGPKSFASRGHYVPNQFNIKIKQIRAGIAGALVGVSECPRALKRKPAKPNFTPRAFSWVLVLIKLRAGAPQNLIYALWKFSKAPRTFKSSPPIARKPWIQTRVLLLPESSLQHFLRHFFPVGANWFLMFVTRVLIKFSNFWSCISRWCESEKILNNLISIYRKL